MHLVYDAYVTCVWLENSNMKRYRRNECISEPATAFKVDERGCLNKHQPLYRAITVTSHIEWVECICRPWNVTLITPHLSLSLCWWCH